MLTVTATNLPRLMACNGSRLMGESEATTSIDDTVRKEGIAADWLVGQVHSGEFEAVELVDRKAPNGVYITSEMLDYLEEYLKLIQNSEIEVDTTHGADSWRVNGRADAITYYPASKDLQVSDLKYGWKIVEPEMNWTLISHALGWIANNPDKKFGMITFTIYQPRPHHPKGRVRSWKITYNELTELWTQIALTLSNPTDVLNTGEHCYGCPALATCPAARKAQMNAIDATEKAFIDNIDNKELAFQLDHLKRASAVLKQQEKAYTELALHRVRAGQIVDNYAVDNELTNRMWLKHVTPELMENLTGKKLVTEQLITPAAAERAGVSKEVVASFVERRNKGVKLVRIDANTKAEKLFKP